MDLKVESSWPYAVLQTPPDGWQGAVTGTYLHTDGPWYLAPLPKRWHRCRPHSVGVQGSIYRYVILRCACGGALVDYVLRGWDPGKPLIFGVDARWMWRNSRRSLSAGLVTTM